MIRKASLFILWFSVWALLSWPFDARDAVFGAAAALLVSVVTADILAQPSAKSGASGLDPVRFIRRCGWFIVYLFVFVWECLKANIDVAYRVLHPDLPIRPGTIRVKTGLKSDIGLTFLANSITLTPGTTTVDVDKEGGTIYVHWLYVREGYGAGQRPLPVVARFERILGRVFE